MRPAYIKLINENFGVRPAYSKVDSRKILQVLLNDIEDRFKQNHFNEIAYTIRINILEDKVGTDNCKALSIVRKFLKSEGKAYYTRDSANGRRYIITVKREELERWKRDALN
jgi:hypothetical protein